METVIQWLLLTYTIQKFNTSLNNSHCVHKIVNLDFSNNCTGSRPTSSEGSSYNLDQTFLQPASMNQNYSQFKLAATVNMYKQEYIIIEEGVLCTLGTSMINSWIIA